MIVMGQIYIHHSLRLPFFLKILLYLLLLCSFTFSRFLFYILLWLLFFWFFFLFFNDSFPSFSFWAQTLAQRDEPWHFLEFFLRFEFEIRDKSVDSLEDIDSMVIFDITQIFFFTHLLQLPSLDDVVYCFSWQ